MITVHSLFLFVVYDKIYLIYPLKGARPMAKNRILVVEDDTYIAENIGINLDMSGYDYRIMDDGLCAAEHLKNDHSYDGERCYRLGYCGYSDPVQKIFRPDIAGNAQHVGSHRH